MTHTARDRRAITQRVGARVRLEGDTGVVVGHYDDDTVFVLFDGTTEPDRCWVESLIVIRKGAAS